jgi:hypothetical protein
MAYFSSVWCFGLRAAQRDCVPLAQQIQMSQLELCRNWEGSVLLVKREWKGTPLFSKCKIVSLIDTDAHFFYVYKTVNKEITLQWGIHYLTLYFDWRYTTMKNVSDIKRRMYFAMHQFFCLWAVVFNFVLSFVFCSDCRRPIRTKIKLARKILGVVWWWNMRTDKLDLSLNFVKTNAQQFSFSLAELLFIFKRWLVL